MEEGSELAMASRLADQPFLHPKIYDGPIYNIIVTPQDNGNYTMLCIRIK